MSAFTPPTLEDVPTVGEMVAAMDRTVAGLDDVKHRLALTLYRFQVAAALDRPWRPNNLLLMGPSGGGKTHTLRALLSSCRVVWAEANATEYSDVGFHGRSLTSAYTGLVEERWRQTGVDERGKAQYMRKNDFVPFAERWGVLLIDEFDKLRTTVEMGSDRQGGKTRALQAELLKLVEGAEILVQRSDDDAGFMFSTHRILHIAVGAFQELGEIVAKARGISGEVPATILDQVAILDVVRYGFLEELVGRFATIVPLPPLTVGSMTRVLREQVLPAAERELADAGLELVVDEGGAAAIASYCQQAVIGARALAPYLDSIIWRAWVAAPRGAQIYVGSQEVQRHHATVRAAVTA